MNKDVLRHDNNLNSHTENNGTWLKTYNQKAQKEKEKEMANQFYLLLVFKLRTVLFKNRNITQ